MSQLFRTINIASNNLGGSSAPTLLLTFDDQPIQGIYKDYFPVVWKVSTFQTEGPCALRATYTNQLTFVNSQVQEDNVITAATWVNMDPGQKTDLIELSPDAKAFTKPTAGERGHRFITVTNKTHSLQNIGVGFDDGNTPPFTAIMFKNIGASSSLVAEFTPILKAYICSDYKENSLLQAPIQTPAIWVQNLADLGETTYWTLKRDPHSEEYSIVAA